jgi:hypothetical protein
MVICEQVISAPKRHKIDHQRACLTADTQIVSEEVLIRRYHLAFKPWDVWSQGAAERSADLVPQCKRMLLISPDSYVFVYTSHGILVASANTIAHLTADGAFHGVYVKTLRQFFRDFFMSFIGDYRLNAWDDDTLRGLQATAVANSAFMLTLLRTG